MGVYLVTWKLNSQLAREKPEIEALRSGLIARVEAYQHAHDVEFESVYFVSTPLSAGQISADLHAGLDPDDKIIVARVLEGTYCGWLPKAMWDWIEQRL
ncbi:MAG TPA: hypothetical protein VF650_05745 [Allosphingosinicella sp.]|jgi:hypothetical protein